MNGLKVEFPFRLRVVSVDIQSSFGQDLAREYGKFTPTFVFFDEDGEELWRAVGSLDPDRVRETIRQ